MIESVTIRKTELPEGAVARATVKFSNGLIVQNVIINAGPSVAKKTDILFRTAADRKAFDAEILSELECA